jgi:hypothetical protein
MVKTFVYVIIKYRKNKVSERRKWRSSSRARTWGRLGALAVGAGATHSAQPHARRDMHLACALRRLARSGLRPISVLARYGRYGPLQYRYIVYCTAAHPEVRARCVVCPPRPRPGPLRGARTRTRARDANMCREGLQTLYGYSIYAPYLPLNRDLTVTRAGFNENWF